MSNSLTITRYLFQSAVKLLYIRAGKNLPEGIQVDNPGEISASINNWSDESQIKPLRVLFDQVNLNPDNQRKPDYYWQPQAIADEKPSIPYPQETKPTDADIGKYLDKSCTAIAQVLNSENWQNLSWLTLTVEKYGSFIALDDENIAFIDSVRSTAAIAAALASNLNADKLSLIVGDLSGVQKFIYTISSAGALKSLRARSFYLELVTEEIVQQLLETLNLPRTNIIFAGASKLYILAADSDETKDGVKRIRKKFNNWLQRAFQGKVFLALDSYSFPVGDRDKILTQNFAEIWSQANKKLDQQRSQRFKDQLSKLLTPQAAHEPCKVCHRDDVEKLQPLADDNDTEACGTCRRLYRLGGQLRDVKAIVRSQNSELSKLQSGNKKGRYLRFKFNSQETYYYHLFDNISEAKKKSQAGQLFLINNWNLNDYGDLEVTPLLLGNYSQRSKDDHKAFATAEELANASQGIKRIGYVRMDVDNLGQIFARGLGKNQTLTQIASLSRQMTYFFKVYLNSLAENQNRHLSIIIYQYLISSSLLTLSEITSFSRIINNRPISKQYKEIIISENAKRDNLLFIYAGGDDLFISGAWNEIVEFSFDIYQCFRAYTCKNSDITISAGVELAEAKFPLYQAADKSGKAEDKAKDNGRDSLTLFGETFKWDEWLGTFNPKNSNPDIEKFLENKPPKEDSDNAEENNDQALFGVYPITQLLHKSLEAELSRSFIKNLLLTAQIQDQKIKEAKDKEWENPQDIKNFLHLPRVAYTLSRLKFKSSGEEKPTTIKSSIRKALLNPYNAPYYRAIATWIELLNR